MCTRKTEPVVAVAGEWCLRRVVPSAGLFVKRRVVVVVVVVPPLAGSRGSGWVSWRTPRV